MVLLTRTIEFLLLPPGNFLLMILLIVIFRRRWITTTLLTLSFLQILILGLPLTSEWLLHKLEEQNPLHAERWTEQPLPEAIVVLGAGRNRNAIEYGGQSTSLTGIERLRYAALLHRKTGVPILVSGGQPLPNTVSEAHLMAQTLREEFKVDVRWLEEDSHTTWQNAEFSDVMLSQDGIKRAWLVTQGWHMPRALYSFQNRKVEYIPAPTSFGSGIPWTDYHMNYIPQSTALARSIVALHEWIGLLWYQLRS